jgi:hypothetical protein
MGDVQYYKLEISASGEVRDKDGNLLNADVPLVAEVLVTEAELKKFLDSNKEQQ